MAWCAVAALCLTLSATLAFADKIKIVVDFNNTDAGLKDSDGRVFKGVASGLGNADKTAIMNKIKQKYEDVFGAGEVTVEEAAVGHGVDGGDYSVVVTNDKAPGGEYGDKGVAGGPAFVYLKEFTDRGFDATKVGNYAGETGAHEVGHQLGVKHNEENGKLMSKGANAGGKAGREADARSFLAGEAKTIKENAPKRPAPAPAPKKDTPRRGLQPDPFGRLPEVRYASGAPLDPEADDRVWGSVCSYTGPTPGLEVGYINEDGDFFYCSDLQGPVPLVPAPDEGMPMNMQGTSDWGAIMALRQGSVVYDYTNYGVGISYSYPNPNGPGLYLMATVTFDLDRDGIVDHVVTLDATNETTTGGFLLGVTSTNRKSWGNIKKHFR